MKRTVKTTIILIVVLLFIFGIVPCIAAPFFDEDVPGILYAFAAYSTGEENGFEYGIYTDSATGKQTASVIKYKGHDTDVVIPEKLGGADVVNLRSYAFNNNETLVSVTLPETLTGISDCAIFRCPGLKSVYIPESLTTVYYNTEDDDTDRRGAFAYCYGLDSFTLESGTVKIADYLFSNTGISDLTIPEGITEIGKHSFANCTSLKKISLPSSLEMMGDLCFYGCTALEEINIPAFVSTSCQKAALAPFRGCTALKTVTFADDAEIIPPFIFAGSGIEEITIPDTVKNIGNYSFSSCASLKSVNLPASVIYLGKSAFAECGSLSSVAVNSDIFCAAKTYTDAPFGGCSALKNIRLNGVKSLPAYMFYKTGIESIVLPAGLKTAGDYVFAECTGLSSVSFPESLEQLGSNAFKGCYQLKKASLPDSLTSCGNSVFAGCYALTEIRLPHEITEIPEDICRRCSALTTVEIPSSVTAVGKYAFAECTRLSSFTFEDGKSSLKTIGDGAFSHTALNEVYFPEGTEEYNSAYAGCTNITEVNIPDGVKSVSSGAFTNCKGLTSVTIPSTVTAIGTSAFRNCTALTNINIDDYSVNLINSYTFDGAKSLKEFTVPKGTASIKANAFVNAAALRTVTIPESVTAIADTAFKNCPIITIKGVKGSYAETFALSKGYIFTDITKHASGISPAGGTKTIVLAPYERYEAGFIFSPADTTDCVKLSSTSSNARFPGGDTVYFTSSGDYTVKARAGAAECTVNFHVRAPKKLEITKLPDKTVYYTGELTDLTGIKGKVTYSDGTAAVTDNFTADIKRAEKEGKQTVTVSCVFPGGSALKASFEIIVNDPVAAATGLEILSLPAKRIFMLNETPDFSGLIVKAVFKDGSTMTVVPELSGYNCLLPGRQKINVCYGKAETEFYICYCPENTSYKLNGGFIMPDAYTTAAVLKSQADAQIFNPDGSTPDDMSLIGTGMEITVEGKTYISVISGDCDGDGLITPADARMALRIAVGSEKAPAHTTKAADISADGAVSVYDARKIMRISVGLE